MKIQTESSASNGDVMTELVPRIMEDKVISRVDHLAPVAVTILSALSTLAIFYFIFTSDYGIGEGKKIKRRKYFKSGKGLARSTVLPGYGLLGDTVNEVVEAFLDTLAIYVHSDTNWDCSRRMLCEANQRANEFGGMGYGVLTYLLSFTVSFLLKGHKVSESMEAMRRGRHGLDCKSSYPKCPFSL